MLKYVISILFFLTGIKVCHSQSNAEQTLITNKNHIEIFYPNYYYYYKFDKRLRVSLPLLNIGVQYKHFNSKSFGIQASISTDYMRDLQSAKSIGQIAARQVIYPSVGFHKSYLLKSQKFFFSIEGEVVGRIGQLTTFGSSNEFETVFGFYDLLDVGISLGGKLTYTPKGKFCFALGLKQSFFPYVFDKGIKFYDIPSSPRNVTTLTIGIGLNFPQKNNP